VSLSLLRKTQTVFLDDTLMPSIPTCFVRSSFPRASSEALFVFVLSNSVFCAFSDALYKLIVMCGRARAVVMAFVSGDIIEDEVSTDAQLLPVLGASLVGDLFADDGL
jgi:hypothetical protein